MLIRYQKTEDGQRKKLAQIYTVEEHGVGRVKIAPEAISVIRRLSRAGYQAYIVGGAIRDLLVGITPKDYDIATDARPRSVRRLFRRSRIIGKRFQLVHVYVQTHIIEVSTFRRTATAAGGTARSDNNIFGTMAEDVQRRDFTMNALYYDPNREQIVDYVGGFEDIRERRITLLKPAEESFSEDPVRMIRALRYAATTGFKLPPKIVRAVRKMAVKLADCSTSRLTEELFKILGCGASSGFIRYAWDLGLLAYLLPELWNKLDESAGQTLIESLAACDARVSAAEEGDRADMIASLCTTFIELGDEFSKSPETASEELYKLCKALLAPLTPPNAVIGKAVKMMLKERGITAPKRKRRRPRNPAPS